MNEQLKKRLTGAVVLVALAVIFIPMLLDGDDQRMASYGSNVPERPAAEFETIDIPLQLPAEPARADARVVDSVQQARTYEAAAAVPAPESVATLATAPPVQPAKPAVTPAAAAAKPTDAPQAWVVQLGSFAQAANAMALRDKARSKGFDAFVEQVKVEGGKLAYRVRVGPEAQRERADTLKLQVAKALGVDTVVMSHP
ncbi:MAG: SPOR domain-containing protein [Gammaproteobacteria bacterium]|nr:SPOR domain-containing protein [Gammaproteobacteria bacterium]